MIRQIFILSLFCALACTAGAQRYDRDGQRLMHRKDGPKKIKGGCPRAYIGFSSGINNPVGILGPQVDIAISPSVSIGSGVGISSWGYKTFIEARYYFKPCNRGWAIGGGFTYNTGENKVPVSNIETLYYGKRDILLDQHAQANFMISGYHFFSLGRSGRNRFHLQAGFSVPLAEPQFVSNYQLTEDGYNTIKFLSPGGLILGFGFSFGAGRM